MHASMYKQFNIYIYIYRERERERFTICPFTESSWFFGIRRMVQCVLRALARVRSSGVDTQCCTVACFLK